MITLAARFLMSALRIAQGVMACLATSPKRYAGVSHPKEPNTADVEGPTDNTPCRWGGCGMLRALGSKMNGKKSDLATRPDKKI